MKLQNNSLSPLLFSALYFDKIWGGNKLHTLLGKPCGHLPNCGESWEISAVPGKCTPVAEGLYAGRTLPDLINTFGASLLGTGVVREYGNTFPLLIKCIDAADDLSVQVHPDDAMAQALHQSPGKTEMWYILQADDDATLINGFKGPMNAETYLKHLYDNTLDSILMRHPVAEGDVFFIPAGRVHTIGKGIVLAEVQQSSDVTYRIYDFDRTDDKGNKRELHTDLALKALDFGYVESYKSRYYPEDGKAATMISAKQFTVNMVEVHGTAYHHSPSGQSFIIYMCVSGHAVLFSRDKSYQLPVGTAILIPATADKFFITGTAAHTRLMEIYL